MKKEVHKWGYWTKEKCINEAQKYDSRIAFRVGSPGAHTAAYHHGWLNEICSHMKILKTHYSKREVLAEARKYTTKTEFMTKAPIYYSHAIRKRYIDDICKHMIKLGSPLRRVIYVFEFADHYVYIGLTQNPERRKHEHLTIQTSPVFSHLKDSNSTYRFLVLTDYMSKEDAALYEEETICKYRKEGWLILNRMKGGNLGGNIFKYTKKYCLEIALGYKDKKEFREQNPYFYRYICKRGWIDDLCSHMVSHKKRNGYWTFQLCAVEASKFNTRVEFQRGCPAAYSAAHRHKWLNDICNHMIAATYKPLIWDKQSCKTEANKYKTRREFKKNTPSAYKSSIKHGWLDELFEDLPFNGYSKHDSYIGTSGVLL